jgi:hypothetical protein
MTRSGGFNLVDQNQMESTIYDGRADVRWRRLRLDGRRQGPIAVMFRPSPKPAVRG